MKIGLKDIDKKVAVSLADKLQTTPKAYLKDNIAWRGSVPWSFTWDAVTGVRLQPKRLPSPIEQQAYRSYLLRKRCARRCKAFFLAAGFGFLWWVLLTQHILNAASSFSFLVPVFWLLLSLGIAVSTVAAFKNRPISLQIALPHEELQAAIPLLELSSLERTYADILLFLEQMPHTDLYRERELRDTLQQLNRLLEAHRQLEHTKQTLLRYRGIENLSTLATEYAQLCNLRDATTDSAARATFEHSIQLCLERIEGVRSLERNLERIAAKQEAIEQTIASARTAMATLCSTPRYEPQLQLASQEVYDTVEQVRQKALATEKAVLEVLNIHSME